MSRPKNPVPNYLKNPGKDEARCWVAGRWVSLGKYGSEESRREYERVCAEVRIAAAAGIVARPKHRRTVGEVVLAFMQYAADHYRTPDGKPSSEIKEYQVTTDLLFMLYGYTIAAEFGPIALQVVRQKMIDNDWCRNVVNKRIGRLRLVFKWAASQELVPASVPHGLACVRDLQRGRTDARESDPVIPVAREIVEATLPFLSRQVRTMVKLQLLTGMRPGEVCGLSLESIDHESDPWVYRPRKHKTAHRGKVRVIVLGPRAKELILAFLADSRPDRVITPSDSLFSPNEAREEAYIAMRAARKTKVQPSQMRSRRKSNPKRQPAVKYTATAYANAVQDAAVRAKVAHWHPNQVRHTVGTEVRKVFGLEAAQVVLGHSRADVTQVYAERDMALAAKVADQVG